MGGSSSSKKLQNFEVEGMVGKGAISEVFRARRKGNGEMVALKRLRKVHVATNSNLVWMERELMSTVDSPFVLNLLDAFQNTHYLYFVVPLMTGTLTHLGVVQEPLLIFIALQLIRGVQAIHERSYVHRDIKPDNVLINESGRVVLNDFGFAVQLRPRENASQGHFTTVGEFGTEGFQAPEMLERKKYGFSVDVWSLGVTLFVLSQGESPYPRNVDLMSGDDFQFIAPISKHGEDFFRKILCLKPTDRLGCENTTLKSSKDAGSEGQVDWNQICGHPFLAGVNSEPTSLVAMPPPMPIIIQGHAEAAGVVDIGNPPNGGAKCKPTTDQQKLFEGFDV